MVLYNISKTVISHYSERQHFSPIKDIYGIDAGLSDIELENLLTPRKSDPDLITGLADKNSLYSTQKNFTYIGHRETKKEPTS